jgi:hypothetical protein
MQLTAAHCLLLTVAYCLLSCGSPNTPLDAQTREAIDSISIAQIGAAQTELDSFCKQRRKLEIPRLVDSIKQLRLKEIQEQLKTVPK